MAKKAKGTRREKREQRKVEREALEVARAEAAARRRKLLIAVAVATVAVPVALYAADAPRALIGIALLLGCGAFLAVGLGGLGSTVKPKDSAKSGNIDFGR